MSKVLVIGTTTSGKTCYFYAMLSKMMRGMQGFSLRMDPKDFVELNRGIKRLGDTRLPLGERFPLATSETDIYNMDLLYNLSKMETFEWIDYPGEVLEKDPKFIELLKDSTCLLLCVDGEAIQGTKDDIDDIINEIYTYKGGLEICNALQQRSDLINGDGAFPPVCVMITKYDKVSEELRSMEIIERIVKESFPVLFHKGGGAQRMVTICPVTLGKEIEQGGKLNPRNVEKPICFANYLIQSAKMINSEKELQKLFAASDNARREYEKRKGLSKIFAKKPNTLTEEEKVALERLLQNGKEDIDALRSIIESLPLYINGVKTDWPD